MTSPNGNISAGGMQTTTRIVVALFRTRTAAEDAIRDLKEAGFTNEQLGMATQDRPETRADRETSAEDRGEAAEAVRDSDRGKGDGGDAAEGRDDKGKVLEETTSGMAEGATIGALTGGVVGGLVGLIGSLLVPGVGPVVVGGVLASTLMGAGIGAATGGLIGALVGMGVPEADAKYFDAGLREGGTLVTVNAGNDTPEAAGILQRHGGDFGPSSREQSERPAEFASQDQSFRYEGGERRTRDDESYSGPERRLVGV